MVSLHMCLLVRSWRWERCSGELAHVFACAELEVERCSGGSPGFAGGAVRAF